MIPGVPEYLWVVDECIDAIRELRYRSAMQTYMVSKTRRYPIAVHTREEAVSALLGRARERVAAAQRELEKERLKLKRIERKYRTHG